MRKLIIDVDKVLKEHRSRPEYPRNNNGHAFYSWLAYQFNGGLIIEAGTATGCSARSFARNPSVEVISYDIIQHPSAVRIGVPGNVELRVQDINEVDPEFLATADVLYLDISHNGHDEKKFLERIEPHFKGILVMDDIKHQKRWNRLWELFRGIEREHHYLPKEIAACRGTGVVCYGDWTVEFIGGTPA
jgi:predicted O-methyltransferase YrrM